jgi:hypothetical protein
MGVDMLQEQLLMIQHQHQTDPAWQHLIQCLNSKRAPAVNLAGPPDPMKSWLAWHVSRDLGRRPCILVPDELRARSVAADLAALTEEPVLIFRPRELSLTDVEASSHETEQQLSLIHI